MMWACNHWQVIMYFLSTEDEPTIPSVVNRIYSYQIILEDVERQRRVASSLGITVNCTREYEEDEYIQRMVEEWFIQGSPSWEQLKIALRDACGRRDTRSSLSMSTDVDLSNIKQGTK